MNLKRLFSVILAFAMIIGTMGFTAFAEGASTLPEAVNGVITLTENVKLSETYMIEEGTTLTINLNSCTIDVGYQAGSSEKHIYAIDNRGTLTLTGNGTINSRGIFNYGELIIENGTYNAIDSNGGSAVWNYSGSELTINDGTFTAAEANEAPAASTLYLDAGAAADINGGTFTSYADWTYAIISNGDITIDDATVNSEHGAIAAEGGSVLINNGSYNISGSGHVVYVPNASVTIKNGSFSHTQENATSEGNVIIWTGTETDTVTVEGGNFYSVSAAFAYASAGITLKGGSFTGASSKIYQGEGGNNVGLFAEVGTVITIGGTNYTKKEDGSIVESDLSGAGTETDPYVIRNLDDLKAFRDDVNEGNNYEGKYVLLADDINLTGETWTPIGNATNIFLGKFDGNNKTISNLTVNQSGDYAGLFGYVMGSGMTSSETPVIKDLILANVSVKGGYRVGAVAGQSYTCRISNVHVTGNVEGVRYVGGISGHVYTYIDNSSFTGNVSGSFDAIGGIAGAGDGRIYDCRVTGDVTGSNWVGGIIANGQEGTSVVNCYVEGNVKTSNNYYWGIGGIAGVAGHGYPNAKIENNYFNGEVYIGNEKVNTPVIGFVNADDNASIESTVEGNSWNTEYYPSDMKVVVTAEVSNDMSAEAYAASGNPQSRNNNLVMLESDLQYIDATSMEDVIIMSYSDVTEKAVEKVVENNKYVAAIDEVKYTTLQAALDAAAAGTGDVTVEILTDIDLTGVDWNPVTVSAPGYPEVTINGNNKTITGLSDMLFAATWAGGSGLIINDLTIKDSFIEHDVNDTAGNIGVGAFIGYPQASAVITLNNCHLVNSTVSGGHWTGGLIGMAGGYNGTDGPVFMNLTIEGCSVTGSTITGKGSVGGIIGHGACAAWTQVTIKDVTVTGNTITSTGDSNVKAGIVMGTIGAAGQTTTVNGTTLTGGISVDATESDNTATSNGTTITTVYGRQGTDTGVLIIAGGTYENYPIEESVSYASPANGFAIEANSDGTYGVKPAWITGKDAGAYGEERLGMMRWLFAIEIEGNIEKSGIKYIKAADITENVDENSTFVGGTEGTAKAFYGDVVKIAEGTTGSYFAVAYAVINGKTYWSKPIANTPDFTKVFTNYNGGNE